MNAASPSRSRPLLFWISVGVVVAVALIGIVLWIIRDQHLRDLFDELPANLGGHMLLSLAALVVGIGVSLPLGIFASRRPRLAEWGIAVAGVLQTIPSLALLALMVPLLGGMIGFWPAFVAMTLYSLLPILANTIIGIRGVDAAMIAAARGLGMSDRQMLLRVQLPLAAPVILGGVRTATVLVVGTATLATPVGEKTLGNYIFEGLNTRDHLMVVFGCVLAALLAVLFDQLVRLLELASRRRSAALFWIGVAGLTLLIGGGLSRPLARVLWPPGNPVVVGTHDYTEQYVLAEVLRDRLTTAGFSVDQRKGMAQKVTLESLTRGGIDCCVEYTGNLWATVMKRTDAADRATVQREVADFLRAEYGVECLGPLGFENAYALAMRRADADKMGIKSLADLRRHAPQMRIGGDMQFFRLGEWERVKTAYGLSFAETIPMDPTLMYQAIDNGQVQVICAYTSDGRVDAYDLVILKDPLQAFPPYDAILLLSEKAARKPGLREALLPLVGAIDDRRMRFANKRVDVERQWPRQAGRELLGLLRSGKGEGS
jgi:osmoprotectant transport system permease protein